LNLGCIIGLISGNNYDEHNCFISIFAVKEEHRLNGIGSALWNALMQHCGNRNLGLNPRPAMIPSYTKRGLTLKSPYDQKIYVGHPQLGLAGNFHRERGIAKIWKFFLFTTFVGDFCALTYVQLTFALAHLRPNIYAPTFTSRYLRPDICSL
jgi:GNAT superfamily N-acetyltransferase